MSPRVSEAARIFVVAAFLVLVAQGPTFSGAEGQAAASASPDGTQTTTDTNKQADKKVEVTDKGDTKESQSGSCTDEKKKAMSAEELAKTCPAGKEGTVTYEKPDGSTGTLGNTSGSGVVGSGNAGAPNPTAVQQYASPTIAALSQVYTPPDDQNQQRINAAFANPSQYIGGQGSPVSAQAVAQAQNNVPASVYSPQTSGVSGTTLGYDGDLGGGRSIALTQGVTQDLAYLSSPAQSQGGLQAAPAYIPPTSGVTMAVPGALSPVAAGFQAAAAQWDASQPLGGISQSLAGTVSPSEVFFADAQQRLTPASGGPVVTRFTSSEWSTFQASGQSLGQYLGTDYPIVVDFGVQGVSVFRGQDFGITTDGSLNIAGVNADTSYMGNGSLQDKITYTLSRTFDSTSVSAAMNSRNSETGATLASAIGAEYAQAKSSETFTDSVYRFFTEHGEPRLTVTGSSLPATGETESVQGPSNAELAQMRAQSSSPDMASTPVAKVHPPTVLGSDANTLDKIVIAGQDGTQSGRALDGRSAQTQGTGVGTAAGLSDGTRGIAATGLTPEVAVDGVSSDAQQPELTLPAVTVDIKDGGGVANVQPGVLMVPESGMGPKVDLPSFPVGPELQARIDATQAEVNRTGKGGLYDFGGGVSLHITPSRSLPPIEGTVVASEPGFETVRAQDPQEVAVAVDAPASARATEVVAPAVADSGPTGAQEVRATQGQGVAKIAEAETGSPSGRASADAAPDTRTWWEKFLGITTPVPSPPEQLQRFAEYNAANPPAQERNSAGFLSDFFGSAAEAAPAQKGAQAIITQFQGIASCYDPLNKTSCGGTKYEGGTQIAGKGGVYLGNDVPTAALKLSIAQQTGCGIGGKDCVARVTNVSTGQSVEVRINDNGPLFSRRVIDLNPAAKQAIGAGDLTNVRVEILGPAGGAALTAGASRSGFQVNISATAPGQKPVEVKMQAGPALKPVSFGIGSSGSTIDKDAYINSLCQPDRGCRATRLGATPDAKYASERVMTDVAERDADYARQVAAIGAKSKGGQGVDVDNCQYSGPGACQKIVDLMKDWNKAHPNQTIHPLINNPLHVAELLGAQEAARLMNAAGSAGGGAIVERGAGTPAQNDALRKTAGVPNAPILYVGTQSEIAPVEAAIKAGKFSNIGTSVSSESEGDAGYRDAKAGLPVAIGGDAAPVGTAQKALAKYAQEIAKQGITFGMPQADGSIKLLSGKEAAALSAADRAKLQAYKQIPLAQGITSASSAQGSFVRDGIRYSPMGSAEETRQRIEEGAKDAVRRALQSDSINANPKLAGLCGGACEVRPGGDVYKTSAGGEGEKVGSVRYVNPRGETVADAQPRLTYRGGVSGLHPAIQRSMQEASKLLPPGYSVRVNNAARTGSTVGGGSFHLQRDRSGNALAADVTIVDAVGNDLKNIRSPQTFGIYRDFMQNVKAYQDQLFPQLRDKGRWGGYFVQGVGQDLMHYDLGPRSMMAAGSWEGGLLSQYARYGMPGDIGKGMGSLDRYVLPTSAAAQPYYEFVSADGSIAERLPVMPDQGTIAAKMTDEGGELAYSVEHTPPQTDTRSLWQKTQDYARNTWNNAFGGGAQPYNAMQPAGNAQPAGGSGGGSGGSGAPTSQPQQQQLPLMPETPATTQPASLTCSPSVVSADATSKVSISWQCPSGTVAVGSGFTTVGTLSGTINVSVSTTSSSIRYGIACSGTKTPQTATCTVAVKHPAVVLIARPANLARGEGTKLEWKASDVTSCTLYAPPSAVLAKGSSSGSAQTLPLDASTRFRIRCETGAKPITGSVLVEVAGSASVADTILP